MQNFTKVQRIVQYVQQYHKIASPRVGIVLGTGLGNLATSLTNPTPIPYSTLEGFPLSTVASHAGQFLAGELAGLPVLLQQGRCHLYEGYTPEEVCMGVRVMAGLGVTTLIITNAAGCLNPQWDAGQLMLVTDHINMTGHSALTGPNHDAWGPRFPDMTRAYDADYLRTALACATRLGLRVERGVYVGVQGPHMETPAETRFLRTIGGDAVGMSTVLEVMAARHMGLRVLVISCLTNKNLPDCMQETPLEDVIRVANAAGADMEKLIHAVLLKFTL